MPFTTDIVATYKGPRTVFARLLSGGPNEPRALACLMGGCVLVFLSQLPPLSRQAHLQQTDLQPMLGGALMAWIFVAPLLLYALAWLTQGVARVLGKRMDGYGARMALFWALLASGPLVLLNGLTAGFVGPGPALTLVGALWFGVFLWFWISGLRAASQEGV